MNQNGLKINTSPLIDQFNYTYILNTNKLKNVRDQVNEAIVLKMFFNLLYPQRQAFYLYIANKRAITYNYEAACSRHKKVAVENSAIVPYNGTNYTSNITTTKTYINGFVYESKCYNHASLSSLQYALGHCAYRGTSIQLHFRNTNLKFIQFGTKAHEIQSFYQILTMLISK